MAGVLASVFLTTRTAETISVPTDTPVIVTTWDTELDDGALVMHFDVTTSAQMTGSPEAQARAVGMLLRMLAEALLEGAALDLTPETKSAPTSDKATP